MPHTFAPAILREYDIRGIVDQNLSAADAHALGQSFGTYVRTRAAQQAAWQEGEGGNSAHNPTRVVVGCDGRLSSPMLYQSLIEGLQSVGCHVIGIGLGPTPMLYFSVYHLNAQAGMMVTGSHNPPHYNGFKMMLHPTMPEGGSVYGAAIKELGRIAAAGNFSAGHGTFQQDNVKNSYIQRLLQHPQLPALKVVWDCGNGAAGAIIPELVAQLPGQHTVLFGEVDGKFPNHHPDPTVPDNLRDLQREVAARGADLGIAFDGDADRIGAIDGMGRVVAGDQLLALYAREVLEKNKGATIIADVKASQTLFDHIAQLGGVPLMWKTGHSLIKTKMKETGAPLAGEMSGHIFFADDFYGFDDALYAGLRLLRLLGHQKKSLAALRDTLPPAINTPELRFEVKEEEKFAIVDAIKAQLMADNANVSTVDGVRVSTPQGWWLLRASNTQNVLVARAEANNDTDLAMLTKTLDDTLRAAGVNTTQQAEH